MGGKRYEIGRNPEKQEPVTVVIGKDFFKAGKVTGNGRAEPGFSV
jgi:hypothetical protein